MIDVRVDLTEQDPIGELSSWWTLFGSDVDSYTQKALNPAVAACYVVSVNV